MPSADEKGDMDPVRGTIVKYRVITYKNLELFFYDRVQSYSVLLISVRGEDDHLSLQWTLRLRRGRGRDHRTVPRERVLAIRRFSFLRYRDGLP